MRNTTKIILVLAVLFLATGCYLPLPNDKNVEMDTYSCMWFTIVGQNVKDFNWFMDDVQIADEHTNLFKYLPTVAGEHTITVTFTDGIFPATRTWNLTVTE